MHFSFGQIVLLNRFGILMQKDLPTALWKAFSSFHRLSYGHNAIFGNLTENISNYLRAHYRHL